MAVNNKIIMRRQIRERIATMRAQEFKAEASSIFAQLEQLDRFREAKTVALFWSLPDELPTHLFVERWMDKKRILLPVITGNSMEFHEFSGKGLTSGSYNIMEPQQGAVVAASEIDLMVLPGVGYNLAGKRLGRGKGFYDKYLAAALSSGAKIYTVGICLRCQLCETIVCQPHDMAVDTVITAC